MADKTREGAIPVQSRLPFYAESANPGNAPRRTGYNYVDEQGKFLYQVVRLEGGIPGGSKRFFQRRKDENDKWVRNLDGVRSVPYRLPELMKASTVFVVEGEKDADRLVTLGLDATTNSGGAGKWHPEFTRFFKGKAVVVLSDSCSLPCRNTSGPS
jgi:putative DNA primase/helicase